MKRHQWLFTMASGQVHVSEVFDYQPASRDWTQYLQQGQIITLRKNKDDQVVLNAAQVESIELVTIGD